MIDPRNIAFPPGHFRSKRSGYSLLELLVAMALMAMLMGLSVAAMMGFRTPGLRQGAISQLMGALDEARMSAIESGAAVYVAFADGAFPDAERRFRGFILYREFTAAEREALADNPPAAGEVKPLTRWQELPRGFYLDASVPTGLLGNAGARVNPVGLPGEEAELVAVGFNRLGQVVAPLGSSPELAITEARYDSESDQMTAVQDDDAGAFLIRINRLTGRLQLIEPTTP